MAFQLCHGGTNAPQGRPLRRGSTPARRVPVLSQPRGCGPLPHAGHQMVINDQHAQQYLLAGGAAHCSGQQEPGGSLPFRARQSKRSAQPCRPLAHAGMPPCLGRPACCPWPAPRPSSRTAGASIGAIGYLDVYAMQAGVILRACTGSAPAGAAPGSKPGSRSVSYPALPPSSCDQIENTSVVVETISSRR